MNTDLWILYFINMVIYAAYGCYMLGYGYGFFPSSANRKRTFILAGVVAGTFGLAASTVLPFLAIWPVFYLMVMVVFRGIFHQRWEVVTYGASFFTLVGLITMGILMSLQAFFLHAGIVDVYMNHGVRSIDLAVAGIVGIMVEIGYEHIADREKIMDMFRNKRYMLLMTYTAHLIFALAYAFSVVFYQQEIFANRQLVMFMVGYILFSIVFFLLIQFMLTFAIAEENNLERVNRQLELQIQNYNYQAKYISDFRQIRHDYKAQLHSLRYLMNQGEWEKAKKFVKDLDEELEAANQDYRQFSNNGLLDAIMNDCARHCKKDGIEFTGALTMGGDVGLSDFDLSTLFYNVLKNAREAAEKPGVKDPFVRVVSNRRGNWVNFRIENSYDGEFHQIGDKILTTKEDTENHGIGVQKIKSIVEKVEGIVSFVPNAETKIFTVAINFRELHKEE